MKFKYTILFVESVPNTLDFYGKAFGFKTRFLHEGKDYGELDAGETTLAFSSLELMTNLGKNPSKASSTGPMFEIAFETDDVKHALEKAISAGAILIEDATEQPWGQTTSHVSDPNGFLIEICSPVKNTNA